MTPEERARQIIDELLLACGWQVQSRDEMNIFGAPGVAVREFPLVAPHGEADYLLYVDGEAAGVIEAKPKGFPLKGVETQSARYTDGLPDWVPAVRRPLPFAYESTGEVTQFTNALEPAPRSRDVFAFHRPEELRELLGLEKQSRERLLHMPPLPTQGLWPAQVKAILQVEGSLRENRARSLVQMATGAGKTFTAVALAYRLLKFGGVKRILFLVDRKNLGKQTFDEFSGYVSPFTGRRFPEEYNVQHLRSNAVQNSSRVVITTVQRLYSLLQGEAEFDEANEEVSAYEREATGREPLPVRYDARLPIGTFDFIIVDECHRSIYNLWRQTLEYFDASLIGLTATPTKQTIGFFGGNLVMEYGHEQALADGVNVGFDVYRIRTQISESGAKMEKEPGFFVPRRDRRTRARRLAELEDDLTYTANQLDRDVVAEDQIRLVVRTWKQKLFTEIFPGRTEIPKTLVFAKDDSHADDITRIIREEFGEARFGSGNDFCRKITYRTTGAKPEELLNAFRTQYFPRIAVSVDMIATGTDVKPLECLVFLRNVKSAGYFEQMKGRGTRVIDTASLRSVTPDAASKTHFVIVDAVGVCEEERVESQPLERKRNIAFEKLLEAIAMGDTRPDMISSLAGRLARLDRALDETSREQIAAAAGTSLKTLTAALLASLDPDLHEARARQSTPFGADEAPSPQQIEVARREVVREALGPLFDPKARNAILDVKRAAEQIIDEVSRDELLHAGFDDASKERAGQLVQSFKEFIATHHDEIEALRILYVQPYRSGLRLRDIKELARELMKPPVGASPERLWLAFTAVEPDKVRGRGSRPADVIALVRHALDPQTPLVPHGETTNQRFQAWLEEQAAMGIEFTPEQLQWLEGVRDHIASSLRLEDEDLYEVPFSQWGGKGRLLQLFGERLQPILDDLNERLAA